MSYPTQSGALNRLEAETRRAGRAHEDLCARILKRAWYETKHLISGSIMADYWQTFPGDTWTLSRAGPTIQSMASSAHGHLSQFHDWAKSHVEESVKDAYRHEALRQVWMLDMLTPPSRKPKLPAKALQEAARPEDAAAWDQALNEWLRAYAANLNTNLRLEALHGGSLEDAAAEVDATKVDGFDPEYKLASMLSGQILKAQRDARADVTDENGDLVAEEIFQTMEDSAVCEDCDSQDGKRVEDVEMLPHVYGFNCRCFERIVPRDFAELLRGGDEDEKAAALDADARGLIPDSMAIRGPDGKLMAHIHIDFEKWMGEQGQFISGRAGGEPLNAR